jgi:hypothetical protein
MDPEVAAFENEIKEYKLQVGHLRFTAFMANVDVFAS